MLGCINYNTERVHLGHRHRERKPIETTSQFVSHEGQENQPVNMTHRSDSQRDTRKIPSLTSPGARFFLWKRFPVPTVERRIYLDEVQHLDASPDHLVSIALPESEYYDLTKGRFFPEFLWIERDLNLMTIADFQKLADRARQSAPTLFERTGPIVQKRYGTGGDNKVAVLADVLGFSALIRAHPNAYDHVVLNDPQRPELGNVEIDGTSESHGALVHLLWNLHRELFVAEHADENPAYSHIASDAMLLVYNDLPKAIDAAARVLRWSLHHSRYSLRIGIGCGTFNSIPVDRDTPDKRLLDTATIALFYGTAHLAACEAETALGEGRGPCIVLSNTCELLNPVDFHGLVDSHHLIPSREGTFDVNYLANVNPQEHSLLRNGLKRQQATAIERSSEQRSRYERALADFRSYQKYAANGGGGTDGPGPEER